MDATNATGISGWGDILLKGVSSYIDSQAQKNFLANEAKYNTAGGTAGQGQSTTLAQAISTSPLAMLGVAAVAVVVIVLVLRR